ncbi:MAG: APC family permease [Acidobacteriota bacterium]|nr:APC family permease [Acidobacteriota bacterium]
MQQTEAANRPHLERGLTASAAMALNIIDMVGVGPFVTLPLIVAAMGGPQAMLGWVLGAMLSMCDGMVWSELGTAYPQAGGSYAYLRHVYGPRLGRRLSFLYAWQLLFSAPLSIASGCLGCAQYLAYFAPRLLQPVVATKALGVPVVLSGESLLAMLLCVLAVAILYRRIQSLDKLLRGLGLAVLGALLWIIVTGFTHFHPQLAFSFPAGAFRLQPTFFSGLASGMLLSVYDYWGYYNVCFLGAEVKHPRTTIPRAVLGSIAIVGLLYLLMSISVLGVLPWQSLASSSAAARSYVMAAMMQQVYGGRAAAVMVVLVALAASASVLALLLGYSRIPYAAASDDNFPRVFARLHPRHHMPHVALLTLAGMTLVCCLFRLQQVITTLVVVRILFQFLLQGVAVLLPQHRRARRTQSFRMPLYPLPALLALGGFVFILLHRPHILRELQIAGVILLAGLLVDGLRPRSAPGARADRTPH